MILIPYFLDLKSPDWMRLGLFLCEGGRSAWYIDDTDTDKALKKMLLENGFPVENLERVNGTVYAKIAHSGLKMSDFYMWHEVDPKTSEHDVWRIFNVPTALWSCPVFKEHFWKTANLPMPAPLTIF